jgi:hypothetical protein
VTENTTPKELVTQSKTRFVLPSVNAHAFCTPYKVQRNCIALRMPCKMWSIRSAGTQRRKKHDAALGRFTYWKPARRFGVRINRSHPMLFEKSIRPCRVRAIAFGKVLPNTETYRFPLERLERARNRSPTPMLFEKSNQPC